MKKLKLKLDVMKEMLTKEQMRKISGGSSGYHCGLLLNPSFSCNDGESPGFSWYCSSGFSSCYTDAMGRCSGFGSCCEGYYCG